MPSMARMPNVDAARAAASGKKYMSLKQVMPPEHFGAGEAGAVMDELRRQVGAFGRPDVLVQPFHQRQVVGHAAHRGSSRRGCAG